MTNWHDTMVDRPETDEAAYLTGWTISGLAVLGTIVAVWLLGIQRAARQVANHHQPRRKTCRAITNCERAPLQCLNRLYLEATRAAAATPTAAIRLSPLSYCRTR